MKLFIAEKKEVANAIATILGITSTGDGFFQCGEDKVTWCFGHMLELCEPEDFNPELKKWSLDSLPIVNIPWRYKIIPGREKQLRVIKSLLDECTTVVHAGDSDDEGQLLVDEILDYYRINKPVLRLLINDNNDKVIRRSIASMKDNKDFYGQYQKALARSVADQLYGINMSRLYTLKANETGIQGVFSVGRVQTPILGLVVSRDRAIAAHKKQFYYSITGNFNLMGKSFTAAHKPAEDAPVGDNGKIIDVDYANAIITKCKGANATITAFDRKEKKVLAPLCYDLLELQVDASRKFGLDPNIVLEITQTLREKYKLITYNRSDCRYLSEEQHADAPDVLAAVAANAEPLSSACGAADPLIKGRVFNSANVTAHHAIVPTEARKNINELTENERNIYLLIARAYVAQFWPDRVLDVTALSLNCADEKFNASQSVVIAEGWKVLYSNDGDNQEIESDQDQDQTAGDIQSLAIGNAGSCADCKSTQKETEPPKAYTMPTLLKDLKRVAAFVKNPAIAKILRERDKESGKKDEHGGIGTPATRDSFIVKLLERGFFKKSGKNIISTEVGRNYHDVLPEFATQPDLTALWHQQQKDIEVGNNTVNGFIKELVQTISVHIDEVKSTRFDMAKVEGLQCPACQKKTLFRIKKKDSKEFFWGCRDREECGKTYPDKSGKPDLTVKAPVVRSDFDCKACGSKLVRRVSAAKKETKTTKAKPETPWYGCSGFPNCKQTYFEKNGAPDYK
jgi:DNA topoisomerase III